MKYLISLFFYFLLTSLAHGEVRIVPFDRVTWSAVSAIDQCEIKVEDEVTHIEAVFRLRPPQPVQLYVKQPAQKLLDIGVEAHSVPPSWAWLDKSYESTTIRMTESDESRNTFKAELGGADLLLTDLSNGNWLNISSMLSDIYFPTVNFQPVIKTFYECQKKLPPVSYESVRHITFLYPSGAIAPDKEQRRKIEDISELIKKDKRIRKILIDGHTDGTGDSITNLSVSRRRAQEVATWFNRNGISDSLTEVRGHGDRYPVASGKTEAGQNKNRRVEIRLIRK